MNYRKFIEENFLIDEPRTGKLVKFKFNSVQEAYYKLLVAEGLENGVSAPLRELVLKARREGMSSLILALFCADDILSEHPTESQVISYKDDATQIFIKRYKTFAQSFFQLNYGYSDARRIFDKDTAGNVVYKHNGARFHCGTASARTGERGGVLQKLHFSEMAFYPDTERMTAKEIVEGTLRQVDVNSGWVFGETTANGLGNHFANMWHAAENGEIRFKPRFWGWRDFYLEEDFEKIKSEFTDKGMIKQEYPETAEEAFIASTENFTNLEKLKGLIGRDDAPKEILGFLSLQGTNYIDQAEIIRGWLHDLERQHPRAGIYAGVDVAKIHDETIVTALGTTQWTRPGVRVVTIDSTGIGDYMPDWFEKNTRWYIKRVKFSPQQKDMLYKNLRQVIENSMTKIPERDENTKKFWEQLLYLQQERKGSLVIVSHPQGDYFDDYPDSWALAEMGYTELHGAPASKRPTEHINPISNFLNAPSPRKTEVGKRFE